MSLNHQVDVYCERTDFSFWSEPINALTNIAFIITAFFALRTYHHAKTSDGFAIVMIVCLFAIGIGSFLFHTTATWWAAMTDIIPIGMVILTYHVASQYRIAGWSLWRSFLSVILFPMLGWVVYQLPLDFMGSTKAYLPILPMLLFYSCYHYKYQSSQGFYILGTFVFFALSIAMRVMDEKICDVFPLGTHWLWHIFNALALYLAFQGYFRAINKLKKF